MFVNKYVQTYVCRGLGGRERDGKMMTRGTISREEPRSVRRPHFNPCSRMLCPSVGEWEIGMLAAVLLARSQPLFPFSLPPMRFGGTRKHECWSRTETRVGHRVSIFGYPLFSLSLPPSRCITLAAPVWSLLISRSCQARRTEASPLAHLRVYLVSM